MKKLVLLLASLLLVSAQDDGSSPEEICPCQKEDTCEDPRHVYGTDPLDIQNFGLIPPCKDFRMGFIACCPKKPPPPKELKLSAQELQSLSPEELLALKELNGGPGVGTGSLPLSLPANFKTLPPVAQANLLKPGSLSLPPAETAKKVKFPQKLPSTPAFPLTPYPPAYPPTYPPTYPPAYPPTYPPAYPPTYPPAYPPTYPPTYPPAYPPKYPPTYSPTYPPAYPPTYPPTKTPYPPTYPATQVATYPPYPQYQPIVYPSMFQAAGPVLGMHPTLQLLPPLSIFRPKTSKLFKWKKF